MAVTTLTARVAKLTANVKAAQPATNGKASKAREKAAVDQNTGTPAEQLHPAARPEYATWKKADLQAAYAKTFGIKPADSTTGIKLAAALTAGVPANRTHAKQWATAQYVKAMKCNPSKTWNAEAILDALKAKRLPGQRKGGTVGNARKLISAAVSLGVVTREQAKGRSAWKADEVHAFVAKHRLTERIQVIDVA
jgi:hypothetical protein